MSDNVEVFEALKQLILDEILKTELNGFWHPMYGGLVFELEEGNRKTSIGGVFISRNHVSFEFSNGYLLKDDDKILEGGGKYRRHIKLRKFNDVQDKLLIEFFIQAHILQSAKS